MRISEWSSDGCSADLPGTHDNTVVSDGTLQMVGTGLFDDIADFDAVPDLDAFGGVVASGTYTFSGRFDLESVQRVRLTSVVDATRVNVLDRSEERRVGQEFVSTFSFRWSPSH